MKSLSQLLLLAAAMAAGLLLAYVDSLPNWDDAGVIVGSLLLVSGLFTLLGHRRPWLIALAVGIWIPLHAILVAHDPGLLVIMVFPFLGAYAGFLVRSAFSKGKQPA